MIYSKNKQCRVLALSATPGKSKADIQEVLTNLYISRVEVM